MPSSPSTFGSSFPVDLYAIAHTYGLRIEMFTLTNVNGILVNDQGTWTIGVNRWLPLARRRFTMAHEIAHYELHRNLQQYFTCRSTCLSPIEIEANARAAEILMPEELVAPWILSLRPTKQAALHFGVSQVAFEKRMLRLCHETDLGRELEEVLSKQFELRPVAVPNTPAVPKEPDVNVQVTYKRGRRVVYTYL